MMFIFILIYSEVKNVQYFERYVLCFELCEWKRNSLFSVSCVMNIFTKSEFL